MTINEIQIIDEFKKMIKTPIRDRRCRLCEYEEFAKLLPDRAKLIDQRRFEELAEAAGYRFPAFCSESALNGSERDPQVERDPLANLVGNLLSADMQLAELRRLIADSLGKLDRLSNKS